MNTAQQEEEALDAFAAEKANISRMAICHLMTSKNAARLTKELNEAQDTEIFDIKNVTEALEAFNAKGAEAEATKARFLELSMTDISISELIALVKETLNLNATGQNRAA